MNTLFLAHLGATLAMVGLIWVVQLVHYPLFAQVGADTFGAYHTAHTRQITWIVAPTMGIELVTGGALVAVPPSGVPSAALWLGFALLLVVWGSTALIQMPLHARLARGFDMLLIERLVATNWLRTLAWSARAALVLWMTGRML